MFQPASQPTVVAFVLICVAVVAMFLLGVWRSAKGSGRNPIRQTALVAAAVLLWLGLGATMVKSGWVAQPGHLLVFGPAMLLVAAGIGFSPVGRGIALACPLWALLAFQGFRLPLELVLHAWVEQGVIPATMTWTGQNWDIVSGIVALGLAPFCRRSLAAAWVGNGVGFLLLLNVGRVAVLSAPVPFGWADVTPKLTLPFHLPYALIVPVCVGGALAGHIILTRALLKRKA